MAMVPENDRMPLVIVGTGSSYATHIEELIEKHKLNPWVIRITGPSLSELNILYRKSHFSVYPSLMEGFGLPVLESIMTGTPVITTRRSSLTEAGGEIAHYINGDNAEELSAKIIELTYKAKDGGNADAVRKHLEKFDAKKLTEQLNELYKMLDVRS
jgi:glycosyltransferase involved in cell wall biosynthesis